MNARRAGQAAGFLVRCRVRGHDRPGRVHDFTATGCLLDPAGGLVVAGDHVALRFATAFCSMAG